MICKDAIVAELKADRSILHEEVHEARKTRDDVKNIAERMPDALKTMAIGRLTAAPPHDAPLRATFVEREVDGQDRQRMSADAVWWAAIQECASWCG